MPGIFERLPVHPLLSLLPFAVACAAATPLPTPLATPQATPLAAPAAAPASPPAAISRTLLDHYDLRDLPGWETRLYLIEYAPGAAAPVHHHPVPGVGYVLSGSFESAFEGEAPSVVQEGHSFQDRALVSHTLFRNRGSAQPLKFVIAYVVKKDAPVLEIP